MRTLKRLTLILIVTGLTSCTKTTNQAEISQSIDTTKTIDTKVNIDTTVIEKYFPADNTVNIKDTVFQTLGIRITITEKTLDTYVTNEHSDNNLKYVDKYRDIERTLKILKDDEVLVDTILTKETFKGILNKEFMDIANFYSYSTNKVESNKIEFFGLIGKPETDWTFAFYHYFDVKTKQFEIRELEDEETE
ncbi:MAG TPA: DUF4738 domain-containing protein [Cyclobacteriaceae bacterium]|nr:DUF4738 domain-containing protein [Cyclobacteriaceae bacterium]